MGFMLLLMPHNRANIKRDWNKDDVSFSLVKKGREKAGMKATQWSDWFVITIFKLGQDETPSVLCIFNGTIFGGGIIYQIIIPSHVDRPASKSATGSAKIALIGTNLGWWNRMNLSFCWTFHSPFAWPARFCWSGRKFRKNAPESGIFGTRIGIGILHNPGLDREGVTESYSQIRCLLQRPNFACLKFIKHAKFFIPKLISLFRVLLLLDDTSSRVARVDRTN